MVRCSPAQSGGIHSGGDSFQRHLGHRPRGNGEADEAMGASSTRAIPVAHQPEQPPGVATASKMVWQSSGTMSGGLSPGWHSTKAILIGHFSARGNLAHIDE